MHLLRHLAAGCLYLTVVAQAQEAQTDTQACFTGVTENVSGLQRMSLCEQALAAAATDTSAAGRLQQARLQAAFAILLDQRNQRDRARTQMAAALRLAPDDPLVAGNQGNLLLREGGYQRALSHFSAAIDALTAQPGHDPVQHSLPALYLNRSLALRALGRYDLAAADVKTYLRLQQGLPIIDLMGPPLPPSPNTCAACADLNP